MPAILIRSALFVTLTALATGFMALPYQLAPIERTMIAAADGR